MATAIHLSSLGTLGAMFIEPGKGEASCECGAALVKARDKDRKQEERMQPLGNWICPFAELRTEGLSEPSSCLGWDVYIVDP